MHFSSHKHVAIASVTTAVFVLALGASGGPVAAQAPSDSMWTKLFHPFTWTPTEESASDVVKVTDPVEKDEQPKKDDPAKGATQFVDIGDRILQEPNPGIANPQCSNGLQFTCTAPKKPKTIHGNGVIELCSVAGVQGILYWCDNAVVNAIDQY